MGLICFGTNLLGSFAFATRIYTPTTPRGYFSYAEPLIYFGMNAAVPRANYVNSLIHTAFVYLVWVWGVSDQKFRGKYIYCERKICMIGFAEKLASYFLRNDTFTFVFYLIAFRIFSFILLNWSELFLFSIIFSKIK